ncbi:MAG: hypothetical protein AB8G17_04740 [Gammaproteobacteria bacterium]
MLKEVDDWPNVRHIHNRASNQKTQDALPELVVGETATQARIDDGIAQPDVAAKALDLAKANGLLNTVMPGRLKKVVCHFSRHWDRSRPLTSAFATADIHIPLLIFDGALVGSEPDRIQKFRNLVGHQQVAHERSKQFMSVVRARAPKVDTPNPVPSNSMKADQRVDVVLLLLVLSLRLQGQFRDFENGRHEAVQRTTFIECERCPVNSVADLTERNGVDVIEFQVALAKSANGVGRVASSPRSAQAHVSILALIIRQFLAQI